MSQSTHFETSLSRQSLALALTAAVLAFLFTGRDAKITMNSVKSRNHAVMSFFLADRTAACSQGAYKIGKMKFPEFSRFSRPFE